jgi:hypothetical protein
MPRAATLLLQLPLLLLSPVLIATPLLVMAVCDAFWALVGRRRLQPNRCRTASRHPS